MTRWMNRFSSPVGIRRDRAAATLSMVSSTFSVRSPLVAEMWRIGAYSRNFICCRILSSKPFEKSVPRPFIRSHLLAATMMPQPAFSASPAIVAS